jgi:glycosyltransferase involved in cell wall biosynthesis
VPYQLVSIVLPVHNQADHVESVVLAYVAALSEHLPLKFEIVLVTNACSDRSPEIAAEMAQKFTGVKTVSTERGGWGLSVKLGLRNSEGDLLCYTNSARTSPEILVKAIEYAIANPNTVVKANRKIRESWQRRLGSLIYNLECRAFFDLPTWDINGTPKLFPRSFAALLKLTRDDDLIDAEFNAICRRAPYPVLEMPVVSTKRHGGASTTNYKSAVRMYWGAYELWRRMPHKVGP